MSFVDVIEAKVDSDVKCGKMDSLEAILQSLTESMVRLEARSISDGGR